MRRTGDGDIIVSFGRLVFWLFETHIVAKAACQSWASERLLHEFAVYEFLRALQGVVIPSLFGMYRNLDDGSSILVISYAGETLRDFNALCLKDRYVSSDLPMRLTHFFLQSNTFDACCTTA
jgi:hypothetical protein